LDIFLWPSGIRVWLFHTTFHDNRFHQAKIEHYQPAVISDIVSETAETLPGLFQNHFEQKPALPTCKFCLLKVLF
jgi:hypothetical protein